MLIFERNSNRILGFIFNVHDRQKFLKSDSAERSRIINFFGKIIFASSEVCFKMFSENIIIFFQLIKQTINLKIFQIYWIKRFCQKFKACKKGRAS